MQKKQKIGIVKKPDILENQVNYVYLALGSNLGKTIYNLELAKYKLSENGLYIVKSSSYYITKSWPNPKFPDYINLVLLAKTNLSLIKLFIKIKQIEKLIGRIKTKKNYPRVCDIDIIDFNGKCFNLKKLDIVIPHPRMDKRNFVLLPLFEINKSWIHPKTKKNIVNLISNLKYDDIRTIKFI